VNDTIEYNSFIFDKYCSKSDWLVLHACIKVKSFQNLRPALINFVNTTNNNDATKPNRRMIKKIKLATQQNQKIFLNKSKQARRVKPDPSNKTY